MWEKTALLTGICIFLPFSAWPANPIRFSGPEVTKLDWNTRSLVSGDFDQDGLLDLAVINNDRAKLELLYQRNPARARRKKTRSIRPNRWEPVLEDSRFERYSLVSNGYMYSLATGDLNGDHRPDLVYTGSLDPLTVRYQDEDSFSTETWTYDDLEPLQWISTLLVRDINLDRRDDLLVLAKNKILLFYQEEDGKLAEPTVLEVTSENNLGLNLIDIDGDGLPDLYYVVANNRRALRVRFQLEKGAFGPEIALPLEPASARLQPWREKPEGSVRFASIDAKSRLMEVFSILEKKASAGTIDFLQPKIYTTGTSSRYPAIYAMGDYNGDGMRDVAAGDPKAARVLLFSQLEDGSFMSPAPFPSFANLSGLAAVNFKGEGKDSLVLLSEKEEILGWSRFSDSGRLGFPTLIPVEGEPLTVAAGDINGDGGSEIVLVEKVDNDFRLAILSPSEGGKDWTTIYHELGKIRRDPNNLMIGDWDRDGRLDLLLLVPREGAHFLMQKEDGSFAEAAVDSAFRKGLLTDLRPSEVGSGDIDGEGEPELLIASAGFVRSLRLNEQGEIVIMDQFNSRRSDDKVSGPLVVDLDKDGVNDLLFYVKEDQSFQFLRRESNGVFRYNRSFEVGKIDPLSGRIEKLGKDGEPNLMVWGEDRFWTVPLGGAVWSVNPLSTYETDLKDVKYTSLQTGDFNADGDRDILALDGKNHVLEILRKDAGGGWLSSLHFTVFDENMHFQGRKGAALEPREMVVADLTGDGKDDFALLIHDRVLLYPQE